MEFLKVLAQVELQINKEEELIQEKNKLEKVSRSYTPKSFRINRLDKYENKEKEKSIHKTPLHKINFDENAKSISTLYKSLGKWISNCLPKKETSSKYEKLKQEKNDLIVKE